MSDHVYTEVTHQSWVSRITQSIGGIGLGLILFVAAFPVLVWNEGRAIETARSLAEGAASVVSVDAGRVDPANEGRLIHVSGKTHTDETLTDTDFGIALPGIVLTRIVEMFQWREVTDSHTEKQVGGGTKTTTTYRYERVWTDDVIRSSGFKKSAEHANPGEKTYAGTRYDNRRETAEIVTVGDFRLSDGQIRRLGDGRPLPLKPEVLEGLPGPLKKTGKITGRYVYVGGDPSEPNIGDLRVSYRLVEPAVVSIVAKQVSNSLAPYATRAGGNIELVSIGHHPAEAMFTASESANSVLTWVLRVVGTLIMVLGLCLVLKPLSVVADVIPVLGNLVGAGTGLVALLVGGAISLLTIAIAWVTYRPLLAGILIGVAVAAFFGLKFLARRKGAEAAGTGNSAAAEASDASPENDGNTGRTSVPQQEKLFLRAMIAAARADGAIDDEEKAKIVRQAQKAGLTNRERRVLIEEIAKPWSVDRLIAACESSKQKLQLYAVSLFAIRADSEAEKNYLRALADALDLTPQHVAALHKRYGK